MTPPPCAASLSYLRWTGATSSFENQKVIMQIRPSRIPRLKCFIVAMALLALPLIATAQNENSARPIVTFAVIGDTGTGDEAQLSVARQMVKQREKTPFEFVLMLGDKDRKSTRLNSSH